MSGESADDANTLPPLCYIREWDGPGATAGFWRARQERR